jgi:hypothetical protein
MRRTGRRDHRTQPSVNGKALEQTSFVLGLRSETLFQGNIFACAACYPNSSLGRRTTRMPMDMKIGFFGVNFGVCGDPVAMIQVAKAAEQAGFESVWTGEYVVFPDPRVAPSPSEPQTPFLDPVVALSHIVAHT